MRVHQNGVHFVGPNISLIFLEEFDQGVLQLLSSTVSVCKLISLELVLSGNKIHEKAEEHFKRSQKEVEEDKENHVCGSSQVKRIDEFFVEQA